MRIIKLDENSKQNILDNLLKRSPNNYDEYIGTVNEILENVRTNKDEVVFEYTTKFDGADIDASNVLVSTEELEEAYDNVDKKLIDVMRKSIENIKDFHQKQIQETWIDEKANGVKLGQKVTPLSKVGVYVPGGKAAYPSSVLMNVIPAKVAGVDEVIMVTPPGKDGKVNFNTLVAAHEAGVDKIYKQLISTLDEVGVKPMNAEGTEFDPNLHNAVMHVEDEAFGENVVAEELQKGYMYKEDVLRHSMVKVAN